MILFRHELRQGWRSLILWTAAIAGFMALISLLFPQVNDRDKKAIKLIILMAFYIYTLTLHPSAQTTNKPGPASRLTRLARLRHSLGLGCH